MRQMRCPRCQAINYEGHITYPICHKCHENLLKCRYCRNYAGPEERCRYLPEWSLAGGEQIVECDYRKSALFLGEPHGRRISRLVGSMMVLSLILGTIIALLIIMIPMLTPSQSHRHSFLITAFIPRESFLHQSIIIPVTVYNNNAVSVDDILIRFNEGLFHNFELVSVSTPLKRVPTQNAVHSYVYRGIKPEERIDVRFRLRAVKPGKVTCNVTLYCGDGEPQGSFQRVMVVHS